MFVPLKDLATDKMPFYLALYKNKKYLEDIPFQIRVLKENNLHIIYAKYDDSLIFIFDGVKPYYYSGLEITKSPYTWIIWFGSVMMIIALIFALLFNHRELWIKISRQKGGNGADIELIAESHKKLASFYAGFENLLVRLKSLI